MSRLPDDQELGHLVRRLRPQVPADFADQVMARAARVPHRPRRAPWMVASAGVALLAAAALLLWLVRTPPVVAPAGWATVTGGRARVIIAPSVETTLHAPGQGTVELEPGALALAAGDALYLLRGRARLSGRVRVDTVQAEVAGADDQTVATVEVDPRAPIQEPPMTFTTATALFAALGGAAVVVTVAHGQAHVTPTSARPPMVLAAGDHVTLPAAAPADRELVDVARHAPPGPAARLPVAEDCKGCMATPPDTPVDGPRIELDLSGSYALGPDSARVTIVEFGDFQCPHCTRAMSDLHELRESYPADVRIVFLNYPLPHHDAATLAAEAALAAGAQGKFWEMHDLILANQEELSRSALEAHARVLGLDVRRFAQDLDTHAFAPEIAREKALAEKLEITGVPMFYLNGRAIVGARDMATWKQLVDEELAR